MKQEVIRCTILFTLLFGIGARAEKEAQRTVDVQAKPACACVTPCNDQQEDSWCFAKWACDVASFGPRGTWRYCNPAVERERIQAKLRAEGCDTADWRTFRDQLIDTYSARTDGVLEAIDTCRKQSSYTSAKKPVKDKFETCVGRLEKLYKVLDRPGLGLSKTTDAYQKAYAAKLAIPAELANEALFRDLQAANLSDAASVKKVVDKIKELSRGAIVVPYVSPGTQSLDNPKTYGRIVAWINSGGLSRYVQFSVNAAPGDTTAGRWQASVVNVEAKSKAYIFDWTRSTSERHAFEYKSDQSQNNQRCYQCHTSGVLAIHPFEAVHEEADDTVAKKLGEGYADWLGPLNETYKGELTRLNAQLRRDYGPALVVVDAPDRTLDGAFRDRAMMPDPMVTPGEGACRPKETAAVAAIFGGNPGDKGCLSCHDKRGSPVVSEEGMQTMMSRYIGLGFMPPGTRATTEELADAARCYVKAYSIGAPNSSLTAWLKAPACE